jgi:hypothetical protein
MDPRVHEEITRRLDAVKASGFISDYWVTWVGSGGKLEPVVRTWGSARATEKLTREMVTQALIDVVAEKNIIAQDNPVFLAM